MSRPQKGDKVIIKNSCWYEELRGLETTVMSRSGPKCIWVEDTTPKRLYHAGVHIPMTDCHAPDVIVDAIGIGHRRTL